MSDFSMVVRVSLAIATQSAKTSDPRALARAAIEAMREPTEAMCHVAVPLQDCCYEDIWQAMIDEALK